MSYKIPTCDQLRAVENFRKFLSVEVCPVALEHADRFIPTERMRELTLMIAEFGLPGAAVRSQDGGLGLGYVTQAMLLEELMTVSADIGSCVVVNCGVAELLSTAPPHLRDRYLPGLLSGKLFGCFAATESDERDAGLESVQDGEHLVIDGEKSVGPNGVYADFIICLIATRDASRSCALVDREEHGYEVQTIEKPAGTLKSAARVLFKKTRVPVANVFADSARTVRVPESALSHVSLRSIGLMRAALEESLTYVKRHKELGTPIAGHRLVAAKLAEMATLVDAARLMCFRVFALVDAGAPCDVEASMAKWFADEMSVKVCRDAVQLHGGNGGLTSTSRIERLAREAIVVPTPDSATEMQKLMISRRLTGISALA